jgi:hypothetical protein
MTEENKHKRRTKGRSYLRPKCLRVFPVASQSIYLSTYFYKGSINCRLQSSGMRCHVYRQSVTDVLFFILGDSPAFEFRCRGMIQKKEYNIQNMAKVWNQESVTDAAEDLAAFIASYYRRTHSLSAVLWKPQVTQHCTFIFLLSVIEYIQMKLWRGSKFLFLMYSIVKWLWAILIYHPKMFLDGLK